MQTNIKPIDQAALLLSAAALLGALHFHLLPALLAGLLVYELIHLAAPFIARRLPGQKPKVVALAMMTGAVVGLLIAATVATIGFFRSEAGSLAVLATRMAEILDNSRPSLPDWLVAMLPENAEALRSAVTHWLRDHAGDLQVVGKEAARGFAHVMIGMVAGAMIAVREATTDDSVRPLAIALTERASLLAEAFRRIVFAQVRISAMNTAFTAAYLMLVLPLFGIHLPLAKTMVAVTFVAGLIPVIGNLVSNTVIVIISLAHSPQVAGASLLFLVVIHKLEYFLNARIVGTQISARAWELLVAMLVMEAIFGIAGVIAAPIYYAYLKAELAKRELV